MIDRAIVATDLSEASDVMIANLGTIKAFGVKKLLLLQCPSFQEVTSQMYPYEVTYQSDIMEKEKKNLEAQGFEVSTKISPGNAKREINRIAQEEDIPLVIVGSRGHSLIGGAFLGGVASEVILNSRKPVLIMRLEVAPERGLVFTGADGPGLTGNILYATDFSPASEKAFETLLDIAAQGSVGEITLLHVQDQNRFDPHLLERLEEFNAIDKNRLMKLQVALEAKGVRKVTREVVYGEPYVEIMRTLEKSGSTMVILGSQGRGFLRELFVGSVSQYIARRSHISVLLVPSSEKPE
jgi:nucleotide-binding universal stress UspA family protein